MKRESVWAGGLSYFRPTQFLGPTLNAWSVSVLFPDSLASLGLAKNRSGRKTQGSAQLSLLWFMDHC